MKQKDAILQALQSGRKLTQKDAILDFDAYRLAAVIHKLKGEGHNIIAENISVPTRYNTSVMIAKYSIALSDQRELF